MLKKEKKSASGSAARKIGKDLDFASSEAYRLLRTNISFSLPDKKAGKIIGVTSPCPQEGKSTTSVNLAYALAEAGNKVLLIDADMRRPSIAKMLDQPRSPGLSNILIEDCADAIRAEVLHENLSAVFSGDIPPNPSELIGSEKLKKCMTDFSKKYDYVIVDLPPVISVSDPLAMSPNIDGMVLVVRHGHSKKRDVQEAMRQLRLVGANVLGFVYNDAPANKHAYHSI